MNRWLQILAAGVALLASAAAHAQTYPSKPITIVVPFAPGSGTDTVSRLVGHYLGNALKQSVVIENKAGANGAIAATYVARAAPDGHTLLMATNSSHSANPSLMKTLTYDPVKDFAAVTRVGSYIFMVVINPEIPAKSLPELIAHAKANPGKLSYASGNTTGIVAGETFKRWAGVDILHVPYKSTPPAINDLIAGRVSMMFLDLTAGLPHVQAGALRALAITTKQRSALLADLPSLHESGVTNYDVTSWAGLFAPAGTPKEIVARLNAEMRRIVDSPEVKSKLATAGFDAFSSTPGELDAFVQEQLTLWTRLIKDAGIEAQ
jgi:tripartite-type tricarboxylate transporter receptor subunit TctC